MKQKDWLMNLVMSLPGKDEPDEFIKVKEDSQNLVFMNFEKTIGIISSEVMSPEYRANCQDMTWAEFRKQNIINMFTGKIFFQNKYIEAAIKILNALNYSKDAITVLFPKVQSPVMLTVDGSDMALVIAPCKARDVSSLSGNETNKPRQEPAGHGVNSVSSASGPKSLVEVP